MHPVGLHQAPEVGLRVGQNRVPGVGAPVGLSRNLKVGLRAGRSWVLHVGVRAGGAGVGHGGAHIKKLGFRTPRLKAGMTTILVRNRGGSPAGSPTGPSPSASGRRNWAGPSASSWIW